MRYALDGVVTVVDAVNGDATLDGHARRCKQVAVADRIVLDQERPRGRRARRDALAAAPRARSRRALVLDAVNGAATAADVLGAGLDPVPDRRRAPLACGRGGRGRGRSTRTAAIVTAHDPNRHDARIRAFCLTSDEPIRRGAFDMFLDLLRSLHGPKLLRSRARRRSPTTRTVRSLIQACSTCCTLPAVLPRWPDADHRSRLVLIVEDLDERVVTRLWDAFLGRPAPDQPDAAALGANPLALPGFGRGR